MASQDSSPQDADLIREVARLLGQRTTQAKAAAARENGKKGGRPKGTPQSDDAKRKISEHRRRTS